MSDEASLNKPTAVDRAYYMIRNMIMRQQLRPGEKTSVIALAASTGLGRTPVKEAITRLSTEGLLAVKGRSGTFVASLDQADVHHMFDLRRMFEGHAAHRAAANVTEIQVGHMEKLLDEMWEETVNKPAERRSLPRFIDADVEFHQTIIAAAGNPYLLKQFKTLNLHMQIVTYLFHAGSWSADQRHAEHCAIFEAVRSGDGRGLESALIDHANAVEAAILAAMTERYGLTPSAMDRPPTAKLFNPDA